MDPTLTIALVIAIGWALSYRAKWKRAERQRDEWRASSVHGWERASFLSDEWKKAKAESDSNRAKWLDARSRYLDSLDEIAALRDGSAAE